ncbi:Fc.00g009690.m01.CDS01 [Cosmosporella sp. VM-42]
MEIASILDQQQRSAAIDALLDKLSDWDLLRIRNRIRNTTLKFSQLEDLPPELFSHIDKHLMVEDVLNCRLVSRGWCQAWTSEPVLISLCRCFFPGLLEMDSSSEIMGIFLKTAAIHLKWLRKGTKKEVIPWDPSWKAWNTDHFRDGEGNTSISRTITPPKPIEVDFPVCYADGNVAWQKGYDMMFVDDLRLRTRQRFGMTFGPMSGRRPQLEALSDKLVVLVGTGTDRLTFNVLFILHLQQPGRRTVFLPTPLAKAYVQGDSVCAVTKSGDLIKWNWEIGLSIQLKVKGSEFTTRAPGSDLRFGGVPGVLFHPKQDDVVYAVWGYSYQQSKRLFTLVVVKFKGGDPTWRRETSIANPFHTTAQQCNGATAFGISLSCKKSNAHGSYSLVVFRVLDKEVRLECKTCYRNVANWGTVSFNVMTETFSENYFESPPDIEWDPLCEDQAVWTGGVFSGARPFHAAQLWNDSLAISWHSGEPCLDGVGKPHIVLEALSPVEATGVPGIGIHDEVSLDRRCNESTHSGQLFLDDDFVVLRARSGLAFWTVGRENNTDSGSRIMGRVPFHESSIGMDVIGAPLEGHQPTCLWRSGDIISASCDFDEIFF